LHALRRIGVLCFSGRNQFIFHPQFRLLFLLDEASSHRRVRNNGASTAKKHKLFVPRDALSTYTFQEPLQTDLNLRFFSLELRSFLLHTRAQGTTPQPAAGTVVTRMQVWRVGVRAHATDP